MTMFKNLVALHILKRAPSVIQKIFNTISSCHIAQRPRFYQTKRDVKLDDIESREWLKIPKVAKKQAQAALLEYLHSTRCLPFLEAESMSKNSPCFLMKLLRRVGKEEAVDDAHIGILLTRFLRYHPINEFEPFFESIGLKHSAYCSFLPRNLMFLSDDPVLLENYLVLCDYGVPRNVVGRIYTEATEVFHYDSGALQSKLIDYGKYGLSESSIIKIVGASPCILMRNGKNKFLELCQVLKSLGIECDWIVEHVKEGSSYSWSHMLDLLSLLSKIGCSDEEQVHIITKHPDILFKDSGHVAFLVIGFVSKFGATPHEMRSLLVNFPNIPVEKFIQNMWNCYQFLIELEMDAQEIRPIVSLYPGVLGSLKLKKLSSLLQLLSTGKQRLAEMIKNDPLVLKNWVFRVRVDRLPRERSERSPMLKPMLKTQFLSGLGFVEDSSEMKRLLKSVRGNELELQERFDCLVHAGLSAENVTLVVKRSPSILNQSKEVLIQKIEHIVNGLCYPMSSVIKSPAVLNYRIQRIHFRLSMYNWLKDQGRVLPNYTLIYLLQMPETLFKQRFVDKHPGGPEHWIKLMKDKSST